MELLLSSQGTTFLRTLKFIFLALRIFVLKTNIRVLANLVREQRPTIVRSFYCCSSLRRHQNEVWMSGVGD